MQTAVMDYRLPGDEDYREEVNDAVDYVQDTVHLEAIYNNDIHSLCILSPM